MAYNYLVNLVGIPDTTPPGKENHYFQSVYPNPFSGNINVTMRAVTGKDEKGTIGIYNYAGKRLAVYEVRLKNNVLTPLSLELGNLAAGLYILKFSGDFGSDEYKLIKY